MTRSWVELYTIIRIYIPRVSMWLEVQRALCSSRCSPPLLPPRSCPCSLSTPPLPLPTQPLYSLTGQWRTTGGVQSYPTSSATRPSSQPRPLLRKLWCSPSRESCSSTPSHHTPLTRLVFSLQCILLHPFIQLYINININIILCI